LAIVKGKTTKVIVQFASRYESKSFQLKFIGPQIVGYRFLVTFLV